MVYVLPYSAYEYAVVILEVILATEGDSEIGYLVVMDLEQIDATSIKTNCFLFAPESKKIMPQENTSEIKLICDWIDKDNECTHREKLKISLK